MKILYIFIILFFASGYAEASTQIEIIKEIPGKILVIDLFISVIVGILFYIQTNITITIGGIISISKGVVDAYNYNYEIGILNSSLIIFFGYLLIPLIEYDSKKK